MDITKLIKNKQKTPTRKTVVPWHCQKRYQASLNQLSFNQTITTACFTRKVASLLTNNKLLARELAISKCDSNEKENVLMENVKYGDIINFSRLKLLDAAENLKKVTSTLDETVTMLKSVESPPKMKPFKVNYNKEFKKRLKAAVHKDTDIIEEEDIMDDGQHNPSETSEQTTMPKRSKNKGKHSTIPVSALKEHSTENTKKSASNSSNVKTDNKKQKINKQSKTNASKDEKLNKNVIFNRKCQTMEKESATEEEATKSSKKKSKHAQLFLDVINDVTEAVIPKFTKPKKVTFSPTKVSSSSSDETATNSETSSEGNQEKFIPSAENHSTTDVNEKHSQNSNKTGVIKKVSKIIGEGEPLEDEGLKESIASNGHKLEMKGIFKHKGCVNSGKNRNSHGALQEDTSHRRVQFAFQDEQQIERVSGNNRNSERAKQKFSKKRPLKENKQNIPPNDGTGCKKRALQYSVEDSSQTLQDDNKILVVADVHQPPVGCQASESCINVYSQNLQPLVVLKDIFKFKNAIDASPSTKVCEGISIKQEVDAVPSAQPSEMNFGDEVQVISCKLKDQENNLSLGNNHWEKKASRREGRITSYKEPNLNCKMRRC